MALILESTEIQNYIAIDVSFQQRSILPYLKNGETQVVRLLGKNLYNALDAYYNADEPDVDAALDALLPYVQRPLVNFAYCYGLSTLNVNIGPTGIGVVSTQDIAPASKDRTDALKQDLLDAAWDAMESLLEFLEDNIDDYELWEESDAYMIQYGLLISSARKFDEILRIDRSRLKYLAWRPTMQDVELLEITPQVSAEYIAELKSQIKAGNVSTDNLVVLQYLQKALAYLTAASEMDEKYKQRGEHYLMAAKKIMDDTPANYATYVASSVYDAGTTTYQRYENEEDSQIFVTG